MVGAKVLFFAIYTPLYRPLHHVTICYLKKGQSPSQGNKPFFDPFSGTLRHVTSWTNPRMPTTFRLPFSTRCRLILTAWIWGTLDCRALGEKLFSLDKRCRLAVISAALRSAGMVPAKRERAPVSADWKDLEMRILNCRSIDLNFFRPCFVLITDAQTEQQYKRLGSTKAEYIALRREPERPQVFPVYDRRGKKIFLTWRSLSFRWAVQLSLESSVRPNSFV